MDRFLAEMRALTADFAELVTGDLGQPVPTCPGWTFKQLATHVGRGHRWAAHIVATRASEAISPRDTPDGALPQDPAQHVRWLNQSADLVAEAVTAAGDEPVWTFAGTRPATFWARRRAHEVGVHLADAQLATGHQVRMAPDFAADGVSEWLGLVAARVGAPLQVDSHALRGQGETLHFHATDLSGTGEWLVTRTPEGITVGSGHGTADVAVRGGAASLLLVLTRRLPGTGPGVEVHGDEALLRHWLEHTPF